MDKNAATGPRFRPLLPANRATPGARVASASETSRASTPISKRKNTHLACQSCRRRKVRCNGGTPRCDQCARWKTNCDYVGEGNDHPRTVKKQLLDTEDKLKAYQELFEILRTKSEDECLAILRRVRTGQDVQSILRHLQDGDLQLQVALSPETRHRYSFPLNSKMPAFLLRVNNPYLQSHMYRHTIGGADKIEANPSGSRVVVSDFEDQYQAPYHVARLIEPLLDSVKPSKWTSVPATDQLLRELLRVYFLHEYTQFPFFHKDYFLQDMAAGRKRFCSSLLVNAVLAAACHAYTKSAHRAKFWSPLSLQYNFSAEARRLKEFEVQTDSLPTIQAGLVMALTCNVDGVDKVGWSHTLQAVAMADRMRIFEATPPETDEASQIVRALTAWSVFCWQSTFCFHFFRPPLVSKLPQQPLPDPSDNTSWYPETWVMYPLSKAPMPIRQGESFKAAAEMRALMTEISCVAFPAIDSQKILSLEEAWNFYLRMYAWYQNLPASLSIEQAVLPLQLSVHLLYLGSSLCNLDLRNLHYFNLVIMLLQPFVTAETQAVELKDGLQHTPQGVVIEAKIRFETAFRLYYSRHGFELYDPLMLQFHIMLGFMTLKTLSNAHDKPPHVVEALRSTLALAIKGLRDYANNAYLGETTFRLLRDAIEKEDLRLLRDLADVGEEDKDMKTLIATHIQSQLPINVVSIAENPEDRRVGNLVAAYKEMGLEDNLEAGGEGN
ncbi:hypothetical protein EDB81DRAFT_683887 [Dactylonectria macrodidyma]|uniref:Zn(2)-C6 fungal-type domain-containing protein n=1 Tax=Dactylonectria macrodidyma TaxID=307937 RepID=A0A9P9FJ03_9HYPO|nr:hypothetical protein EDB81DRAFT_683887 [Dactylonectria macrodidyma]